MWEKVSSGNDLRNNLLLNMFRQVAGERAFQSRNVIALDEATLAIHKDTAVHRYTET